jgi:hypothetical protein
VESLLSRTHDINWYGHKTHLAPLPSFPRESNEAKEIENQYYKITSYGKINQQGMAAMLYKMQGHYWQQGMTDALAKSVADDYIRLLDGYDEDVFQRTCDQWLLSENKFFPKVGELKAALDLKTTAKKWRIIQLKLLMENFRDED